MAFSWLSKRNAPSPPSTASGRSPAPAAPVRPATPAPRASLPVDTEEFEIDPAYANFLDVLAPGMLLARGAPLPPARSKAELIDTLRRHSAIGESPDGHDLLDHLAGDVSATLRQLPAAAQASLALCDNPALRRETLVDAIARDPALAQAVLAAANSVAYGAGRQAVISLGPALDRIGIGGARSIIFANAVDGVLSRPGGAYGRMATEVWDHMVRTAPLARALASAFDADGDEAFAIALLHDVGKLVIFDALSTLRTAKRRDPQLAPAFMRAVLVDLHETLGADAVLRWGMGERAARAIGHHHGRSGDGEPNVLAELTSLAEQADLATYRMKRLDLEHLWFELKRSADEDLVVQRLSDWGVRLIR